MLLAVYWNFQHALGVSNSLNFLAGYPTLSLCLVLGRASTLLTLRSWLFLKHGALFLLLFVTHWIPIRSWCYVLGSGSHSLDATRWTLSWNSPRCCWRYGPPQSWWYALKTFSWNFQRALVGATLRLLTLRSGESHALRPTLLALFWNTPGRSSCYALLSFLKHSSMCLMLRSDLHVLDARLLGFSWSFNTLSWYYSLRPLRFLPTGSWCYVLNSRMFWMLHAQYFFIEFPELAPGTLGRSLRLGLVRS